MSVKTEYLNLQNSLIQINELLLKCKKDDWGQIDWFKVHDLKKSAEFFVSNIKDFQEKNSPISIG